MDRIHFRNPSCLDDPIYIEITFRRWRCADPHGLIRFTNMFRVNISIRIYRHGSDPQRTTRAHNPTSNLAAVRDQKG
jgi:hypothetical protein